MIIAKKKTYIRGQKAKAKRIEKKYAEQQIGHCVVYEYESTIIGNCKYRRRIDFRSKYEMS